MSWSGLIGDVAGIGQGDVEAASFRGDAQGADDDDVVAGEVTDAGVEVVLDAEGLVIADHDGGGVLGSGAGLGHQVQEDALGGGVLDASMKCSSRRNCNDDVQLYGEIGLEPQ